MINFNLTAQMTYVRENATRNIISTNLIDPETGNIYIYIDIELGLEIYIYIYIYIT